ncbi:MAG: PDZ domain-containing protein [Ferruginibacter sp.]|nr:PDZ domain-containing protein [Bacteroidota bacterium]MBX2917892.1 PDZ domain-containing protein [Ferruginibacter sp.]MCB0709278.1 PDZ domain-containing protein [Chitinophagaceae bacterium]MCC7379696.1 PDZ domain-containing protein [Chitinophagaceae bacterium]
MKKIVFTAACMVLAAFTTTGFAQDGNADKGKKETQEIIIRKKGDKDTKVVVEIKGDKITINGKPLSEFKDDEITVNKRNIIIRDGKGNTRFRMAPEDFEGFSFWNDDSDKTTAFLGVTTSAQDEEKNAGGAKITDISEGSAAEKAGLKKGDVIVKINDKEVKNPASLSEVVTSFKPKDDITVYYERDGKTSSAKATLGERKESKVMTYSFNGPDGIARSFTMPRMNGINVLPKIEMWDDKDLGDMSPRVWTPGKNFNYDYEFNNDAFPRHQKLGIKIQDTEDGKGVKVLDVDKDSPADKAGLKKDDVVTEIGGNKITNTDEARIQLNLNMGKNAYNIKAKRNGNTLNFDIKIPKKLKTANL